MLDAPSTIAAVVERLESAWVPEITAHPDYYAWEPIGIHSFVGALSQYPPGRFLDVGCGIGTKLLAAHFMGFTVSGIELHSEYAEVARRLVPEAQITVCNAFDYQGYGDFDVVYLTTLCVDESRQAELESLIRSSARTLVVM